MYKRQDDKITVTLDGKDVTEDIDFADADPSDEAWAKYQDQIKTYENQLAYIGRVSGDLEKTLTDVGYATWKAYAEFVFAGYKNRGIAGYEEYNDIVVKSDYTGDDTKVKATLIEDNAELRHLITDKMAALKATEASIGTVHSFTYRADLHQKSASYVYSFVLTGDKGNDTYKEYVNFTLAYTDTTKPVYDLKFGQPDSDGVELKDGVYFIDSAFPWYADGNNGSCLLYTSDAADD